MKEVSITENGSNLTISAELQEKALIGGDLSKLTTSERLFYYKNLCESLKLNPLSKPFEYINLNGKLTLYAKKDCTEQLRKVNGITIKSMEDKMVHDFIYIVKVEVVDKDGRTDISTGAVNIKGLVGDALANAIMKAETKAKRRATLSLSGLGLIDELELETIPDSAKIPIADEEKINSFLVEMSESHNLNDLKKHYTSAFNYAKIIKDDNILKSFIEKKNEVKSEIEEKEFLRQLGNEPENQSQEAEL